MENTTNTTIHEKILGFINENFITGRSDTTVELDASLIDSGVIDSTGVLELVMFLEETYDIQVDDEEITPENLDTINNIVEFMKSKGISA